MKRRLRRLVTLGLCYIKTKMFLENNKYSFLLKFSGCPVTDSSVELYNTLSYSWFSFLQLSALVFGKECIIQKKL